VTVGLVVGVHDQHRPIRTRGDVGDHAVGYPAAELAVTVRADDDQARLLLVGRVDDRLPGGRSLEGQWGRPEPGRLGQRGAVLGGLLGSLPDVVCAGGVELRAGLRYEPDAERAPHREDDRITPCGQLAAGLGDRVAGEVGAVIGDEHRPAAVGVPGHRTPERMGSQRRGAPTAALPGSHDRRSGSGECWPGLPANGRQQRRRVPGRLLTAHPAR
jgi:hypothetical protein